MFGLELGEQLLVAAIVLSDVASSRFEVNLFVSCLLLSFYKLLPFTYNLDSESFVI